jgi:hypothetical protein
MLKNLHKFFNNLDIPWVHLIRDTYYSNGELPKNILEGPFWWKSHLKLLEIYKGMAKCIVGNGRTVNFWTDLWEQNCLHQRFPHLFTFAKYTYYNVEKVVHTEFLEDLFHLPLSQQAYEEF